MDLNMFILTRHTFMKQHIVIRIVEADLNQLLVWLDFTPDETTLLESEGFTDFEDSLSTTKDELKSMIDGFYKRDDLAFTLPIKRCK